MEAFTERDWEEKVQASPRPVAAIFWAAWCLPSQTALRHLEELAPGWSRRLRLGTVDVDRSPRLSDRYHIQGLPTLLVLEGGRELDRRVGLMSGDELSRLLARHAG